MDDDIPNEAPVVTPGVTVLVQVRNPSWEGEIGVRYIQNQPYPLVVVDADWCDHEELICTECIDDWMCCYYIALPETPAHLGINRKKKTDG